MTVRGDTIKEFLKNKEDMFEAMKDMGYWRKVHNAPVQETKAQPEQDASPQEWFKVELPADAKLTIIRKGEDYYGEVAPFGAAPGRKSTKYPVKMWPEVIDKITAIDITQSSVFDVGRWHMSYVENDKGYPMKVVAVH